jgi:hypothetical protein
MRANLRKAIDAGSYDVAGFYTAPFNRYRGDPGFISGAPMPSGASWVCWQSKVSTDVLPDAPLPGQWLRSSTKKPNWWPGADKIAGSDFGRTQCARRASAMDGASQSTTDTRIFSEQISRSNVTPVNPTERIATDSWDGRLPGITVGDPALGTELGTKKSWK